MAGACIRHTEFPSTTRLFTDYLYDFARVEQFYAHPPSFDSALEAAKQIRFSDEQRRGIVAALREQNAGAHPAVAESLDRLAQPGTVAVTTGQQVGLYGGPAFSVYKALTAIRLSQALNDKGVAAVPVFWLATEDHDAEEVDHAWSFGDGVEPVKLKAEAAGVDGQPVGPRAFKSLPREDLAKSLDAAPFAAEALRLIDACYTPIATFGGAFASLFENLFGRFGLVQINPMSSSVRRLAAPLLSRAVERIPALSPKLVERGAALADAGYHAQVHVTRETALLFRFRDGRRAPLRLKGSQFSDGAATYSASDLQRLLAESPDSFSPNALLRPVVQDYILPTAIYIGGPAELAYLAQSRVLYDDLLERAPVALPRASFTLLDPKSRKRLERYGLRAQDCLVSESSLQQSIAARLVPRELAASLDQQRGKIGAALDELSAGLSRFDPTLQASTAKSRRKIEYQIEKLRKKAARESLRRDDQAARHAAQLSRMLFPNKVPQERLYSIVPFLARHGLDVIDRIHAVITPDCHDHQVLDL